MTVAELIEKLMTFPQDMQVKVENGSETDPEYVTPTVEVTTDYLDEDETEIIVISC